MEGHTDSLLEDSLNNIHRRPVIEYMFLTDLPQKLAWLDDLNDEFEQLKKLRIIIDELTDLKNEYIKIEKLKIKFHDGEPGEIVDLEPIVDCWDDMSKKEFDTLFIYVGKLGEVTQKYLKLLKKLAYLHPDKVTAFEKEHRSKSGHSTEKEPSNVVEDGKPIFNPDILSRLLPILKVHFAVDQYKILNEILLTGDNTSKKLYFKDNGNRLADAFKQLIDADLITGCSKKELESWIAKNFDYKNRGKRGKYKLRYLNDIISTKKDMCQKPLINVILNREIGKYQISKA